jgi:putative flavoprotein involved in K+ transport
VAGEDGSVRPNDRQLPGRQWPPSVVITGVNGGYDVDVRQLAADGVQVVGSVVGGSDSTLAIQAGANQILDQADKAYADFLSAARAFAPEEVGEELAEEGLSEPSGLPTFVDEVDSLNLVRENITSSSGRPATPMTSAG